MSVYSLRQAEKPSLGYQTASLGWVEPVFGGVTDGLDIAQTVTNLTQVIDQTSTTSVNIGGNSYTTINVGGSNTTNININSTTINIGQDPATDPPGDAPQGDPDPGSSTIINTEYLALGRYTLIHRANEELSSDSGFIHANARLNFPFFNIDPAGQGFFASTVGGPVDSVQVLEETGLVAGQHVMVKGSVKNDQLYQVLDHQDYVITINTAVDPYIKAEFAQEAGTSGARIYAVQSTLLKTTSDPEWPLLIGTGDMNTITEHEVSYNTCAPNYQNVELTDAQDQVKMGDTTITAPGVVARTHEIMDTPDDQFTMNAAEQTLTNKTITDPATNEVAAMYLADNTNALINVKAAPPTAGQVLTATDASNATWQDPAGGWALSAGTGVTLKDEMGVTVSELGGTENVSGSVEMSYTPFELTAGTGITFSPAGNLGGADNTSGTIAINPFTVTAGSGLQGGTGGGSSNTNITISLKPVQDEGQDPPEETTPPDPAPGGQNYPSNGIPGAPGAPGLPGLAGLGGLGGIAGLAGLPLTGLFSGILGSAAGVFGGIGAGIGGLLGGAAVLLGDDGVKTSEKVIVTDGDDTTTILPTGMTVTDGTHTTTVSSTSITTGNLNVTNLNVTGNTSYIETSNVMALDRFIYLGQGQPAGANSAGTINQVEVLATYTLLGSFAPGLAGVAQAMVATAEASGLASGDFISITGSLSNDGLYEVHSHTGNILQIRGIGVTDISTLSDGLAVRDFVGEAIGIADTSVKANKVQIRVIKNTPTQLQTGVGSSAPLSYNKVAESNTAETFVSTALTGANGQLKFGTLPTQITVNASASANYTVDLQPTTDDSLALTISPQTLINKSLHDDTTYVVDAVLSTKKMKFDCSGISADTTRTLTVPDASGTIVLAGDNLISAAGYRSSSALTYNTGSCAYDGTDILTGTGTTWTPEMVGGLIQFNTTPIKRATIYAFGSATEMYLELNDDEIDVVPAGTSYIIYYGRTTIAPRAISTQNLVINGSNAITNWIPSVQGRTNLYFQTDAGYSEVYLPQSGYIATRTNAETFENKTLRDLSTWFEDSTSIGTKMRFDLTGIANGATRVMSVQDRNGVIAYLDDIVSSSGSLSDAVFELYDDASPGKIAKFQLSGLSVGTRTITLPDKDGTMAMLSDIPGVTTMYSDSSFRLYSGLNSPPDNKLKFDLDALTSGLTTLTIRDLDGTVALLSDIGVTNKIVQLTGSGTNDYEYADASVGFEDLVGQLTVSTANVPPFSTITSTYNGWSFSGSGTTISRIWANFHTPHTISPTSPVFFHIHWMHNTSSPTGTLTFYIEGTYMRRDNGSGTSYAVRTIGLTQGVTNPNITINTALSAYNTPNRHYVSEIGPLVFTTDGASFTPEVDSIVQFRITRDANLDNFSGAAFILNADLHVQTSKLNTKSRLPPFYT